MLLIVDANVVFSALMRRGKPLKVFELNKLLMKFEFIAPEFLFFEVGKRVDKILKFDCKILSGDKGLKECLPDRVITPSEALEILFGRTAP